MQYYSKATDTVCSIKLKREEFLYVRTIFNFQAECVIIYMLLFYEISAWVLLIWPEFLPDVTFSRRKID